MAERDPELERHDRGAQDVTTGDKDYGASVRGTNAIHAHSVHVNGGQIISAGRDVHNHTHTHYHEAPKINLLAELKAIDNHRRIQQDTLSKRTPDTGTWIFDYQQFPVWRDPKSNLKAIWGFGIPGAGKTVLTSIVVDAITRDFGSSACVGFFYIRYSDNMGLTVRDVLEVLLKQAVEKHPTCLQVAEEAYAEHIRLNTRPSEDEIMGLLQRFTTLVAIFFFLDALDEAPSQLQRELVQKLLSLDIKLFITSRPPKTLAKPRTDVHCFQIAAHERDIKLHIDKEIMRSHDLSLILDTAGPALRASIISSIVERCGGMFLHASLQMASLRECMAVHDVEEILGQFPAKIEDVYYHTWKRIIDAPPIKRQLAINCLLWVLYATRSMTVKELQYAVATSPESHKFDSKRLVPIDALVAPSRGLLVVDEATEQVRLVHYTAKDTLIHFILETFPEPHSLLAVTCMSRLGDAGFQGSKISSWFDFNKARNTEPFLRYAHDAWVTHVRNSLGNASANSQAQDFVTGCRRFPIEVSGRWFECSLLSSLHVVAWYNLPIHLAGFDQATNQDPNPCMKGGETPLHIACRRNSLTTVDELLHLPRILINATNAQGETALHMAVKDRNRELLQLLLSHPQVEPNLTNGKDWTPLSEVLRRNHPSQVDVELVKLLVEHPETDVNLPGIWGRPHLHEALWKHRLDIAKIFLTHPKANVNVMDNLGRTPLMWACQMGQGVPLKGKDGIWSPLTRASSEGNKGMVEAFFVHGTREVVEMLLAHPEVDVNQADGGGLTPLIWASRKGYGDAIGLLLAHHQINVNSRDYRARTPLAWASRKGGGRAVELLLACSQIDVNLPDEEGCPPLLQALKEWLATCPPKKLSDWPQERCREWPQSSAVRLLLDDPRVDVNLVDREGRSPLILLSKEGLGDMVWLLLARPELNRGLTDFEKGWTAAEWAEAEGHHAIAWLLLAHPPLVLRFRRRQRKRLQKSLRVTDQGPDSKETSSDQIHSF